MFGIILPPGVDVVRIMAHTGKQGKRPCLWEGPPDTPQHEIETAIDSDLRVRRWLSKQQLIKGGTATMTLRLELFSQGQRVETIEVKDAFLFNRYAQRKPCTTSNEILVKTLGVLDSTNKRLLEQLEKNWKYLTEQLSERDKVIGILAMLDNGEKLMQMFNVIKSTRDAN